MSSADKLTKTNNYIHMKYKTMRFGSFFILLALCLNACSQNSDNSNNLVVDYQG